MKTKLNFFVLLLSLLLCSVAQATLSFKTECSDKFTAKVTSIVPLGVPSSPFMHKERVSFSILSTERGELTTEYSLEVLKYGPVSFEKDSVYEVELNDGFLCTATKVE